MIYDRNHRRGIRVQNMHNDIIVCGVHFIIIIIMTLCLRFTVLLWPQKRTISTYLFCVLHSGYL